MKIPKGPGLPASSKVRGKATSRTRSPSPTRSRAVDESSNEPFGDAPPTPPRPLRLQRTAPSVLDAFGSQPRAFDPGSTSQPPVQHQPRPMDSASFGSVRPPPPPRVPAPPLTVRTDLPADVAEKMRARHEHYGTVIGALERRVAQLPPGAERARSAAQLATLKSDFSKFSRLLQDPTAGSGTAKFFAAEQDALEMVRVTERLRQGVSDMALDHPDVLSSIKPFDVRHAVAESMVTKVVQEELGGLNKLPLEALAGRTELLDHLKESSHGLTNTLTLAKEEAAMQGRVLEPLSAALTGVGQAEVEGSHGVRNKMGHVLGHHVSDALGMDIRRPNERVSAQINDTYGQFVHATPEGKKDFNLELDPNAKGRLSNQAFVGVLDAGLGRKSHGFGLNVPATGTQLAVESSNDVKLTGPRPGEGRKTQHVTLAPETAQQLEKLRRKAGAPADMAPVARVSDVGRRAAEELRLGDLKTSLIQSFGPGITRQQFQADGLLQPRPGLAGGKANLLEVTVGELMNCSTKEEMLETIDAARVEHQSLLDGEVLPAGGGRTAAALNDMEQAIRRFFAQ